MIHWLVSPNIEAYALITGWCVRDTKGTNMMVSVVINAIQTSILSFAISKLFGCLWSYSRFIFLILGFKTRIAFFEIYFGTCELHVDYLMKNFNVSDKFRFVAFCAMLLCLSLQNIYLTNTDWLGYTMVAVWNWQFFSSVLPSLRLSIYQQICFIET